MNRPLILNRDAISDNNMDVGATMSHSMTEVLSEPSSPESTFDETELFQTAMTDEVTAQLAAAGPIGVAAAAAIATGRKRKRPHSFETNPSIRKRQQTRLLRKLKNTIDEYTTRVGQQAVVLMCMPGKTVSSNTSSYKVFGSQPLSNIIRNCKNIIMQELETQLVAQTPQTTQERENLHELPPLNIDGIPTPVDKMTQNQLRLFIPRMLKYSQLKGKPGWGKEEYCPEWWPESVPWENVKCDRRLPEDKKKAQLRAFIPEMLKYSTGRSKPGWGKPEYRPIWWPDDVPWANVRSDVRTEEVKKKVSWTTALRTIVRNCYHHHGRNDLLPEFTEDPVQTSRQYTQQTMLQTISNPDGSLSIIQVETGEQGTPQIVTLADGSQAQIVHAQALVPGLHAVQQTQENQTVRTLSEVTANQPPVISSVDISNIQQNQQHSAGLGATYTEATLNQDGQIVLHGDTSGLSGVVSIPVSMYSSVVSNLQQPTAIHVINTASLPQATGQASFSLPTPPPPTKQEDLQEEETASAIEVVTIDSSQIEQDEVTTSDS